MQKITQDIDLNKIPRHIAIIMDGNGRWAKSKGLSRIEGHKAGADSIRAVIKACGDIGIKYLTLYAFSVDNWKRPKSEVNALMRLLRSFLRKEVNELVEKGIRLVAIGRIDDLPSEVFSELKRAEELTEKCGKLTLVLALNYGGRAEIVDAARITAGRCLSGELNIGDINEEEFSKNLYGSKIGLPDPELLIRTSGEVRVSNFLLWQISYTEFYITKTLWPDFRGSDLLNAIREFQERERRFGGIC